MIQWTILLTIFIAALSGCWNGGNSHINLGDVSIGQQLIDLQQALKVGAIDELEYSETKQTLLAINTVCESVSEEE